MMTDDGLSVCSSETTTCNREAYMLARRRITKIIQDLNEFFAPSTAS